MNYLSKFFLVAIFLPLLPFAAALGALTDNEMVAGLKELPVFSRISTIGMSSEPLPEAATSQVTEAIDLQIEEFYDNYAYYYTEQEFKTFLEDYEGSFGGVGVSMSNNQNGDIQVYAVLDSGPAINTEITAGDVMVAVDGESILGWDVNLAVSKVRGDIGTPVTLTLRHENGQEYTVTIVREEIISPSVEGEIFEETPNTGYISISEFTEQTSNEFWEKLLELQKQRMLRKLIIDLRSNGGGSLYAAMNIATLFIPEGECLFQEKTIDGLSKYDSVDGRLSEMEIVVLVNEYSASASEVLSGALRDQAGAALIGSTTYGKGITQALVDLPSGAGLRYTRSHYYTPSGFDLHHVGLAVDVEVELPEDITREQYWSTDPAVNPCLQAVVDYWNK